MFTLSGLILETRENLFRDFWSPFSISFYFSSKRNYLKKMKPTMGRTQAGLRPGAPLYSEAPEPQAHSRACVETLAHSRRRRRRRTRCRRAAGSSCR